MGALADDVELSLERHRVGQVRTATDEHLPDGGLARPGRFAERGIVSRDRPPAEDGLSLRLDDLLEAFLQAAPLRDVLGQKHQAAAVFASLRQRDPRLLADVLEESMRHLEQHPRAIAGVGFAAARAAMVEIRQHLERLLQDLVRSTALDIDHETHAAGVVFEPGIVKALLGRQSDPPGPEVGGAVTSVVHFSDTAWISRSGCVPPDSSEQVEGQIPATPRPPETPGRWSGEEGKD